MEVESTFERFMDWWPLGTGALGFIIFIIVRNLWNFYREATEKPTEEELREAEKNAEKSQERLEKMMLEKAKSAEEFFEVIEEDDDELIRNAVRVPPVVDEFAISRGEADIMPEGLEFYNLYPSPSESLKNEESQKDKPDERKRISNRRDRLVAWVREGFRKLR